MKKKYLYTQHTMGHVCGTQMVKDEVYELDSDNADVQYLVELKYLVEVKAEAAAPPKKADPGLEK